MNVFKCLMFIFIAAIVFQYVNLDVENINKFNIYPNSTSSELIYHENLLHPANSNTLYLTKQFNTEKIAPYNS